MSILDASIQLGVEASYGDVAAVPTRGFEGKADAFTREQSRLESVGFRAGMEALRADRVKTVNMGGSASLEIDWLDSGMGMLLAGLLGSATAPAVVAGATDAYEQVFASTTSGPSRSWVAQVIRPTLETGSAPFTYRGCKATGWSIAQSVDGLLMLTVDLDVQDSTTGAAAAAVTYPLDAVPFDWTECSVTFDPAGVNEHMCVLDLSFAAELAMKTDRRYLCATELKKAPVRSGVPQYSGEVSVDFTSLDHYNRWVNQSVFGLEFVWVGREIEPGYNAEVRLTLPACHWTDANTQASLSETPTQALPFQVLDNGTDPVVTLTIVSADTVE